MNIMKCKKKIVTFWCANLKTKYKLTFLWFHKTFTLGLPRLKLDWSITSSWIKLAVCIISDIMATRLWLSKGSLQRVKMKFITKMCNKNISRNKITIEILFEFRSLNFNANNCTKNHCVHARWLSVLMFHAKPIE